VAVELSLGILVVREVPEGEEEEEGVQVEGDTLCILKVAEELIERALIIVEVVILIEKIIVTGGMTKIEIEIGTYPTDLRTKETKNR
jgi:hypothetical protein